MTASETADPDQLAHGRQQLMKQNSHVEFVDSRTWLDLLTSHLQLDQYVDAPLRLKGVTCRQSGRCYVIEEERLAREFGE